MEKRKLDADEKLIKVLFDLEPLDWLRKDNGDLVFLNSVGQKFSYSPEEINSLSNKVLASKEKPQTKPDYKKAKGVLKNEDEILPEDWVKKARGG